MVAKCFLDSEISSDNEKRRGGGAAVMECCRILAAAFLSLLLPLSFLLLARLSAARYFLAITNDAPSGKITVLTSVFLSLICAVAVGAVAFSLTGLQIFRQNSRSVTARISVAWIMLFLMQICLVLGIHGTVDAEIDPHTVGKLAPARRFLFALGLHEVMIFWRRIAVKPAVDEAVFGVSGEGWVEKVVLAVAFGNLWWRRLRDEAEALVMLPWVMAELLMDVRAVDVVGWWLYYLTAAIGGVTVVKGLLWGVKRAFR